MGDVISVCPGCGVELPLEKEKLDDSYNASFACRKLYAELSAYTLSLQDKEFIHQLIVDTYRAQHTRSSDRPIAITFALIGLYLTYDLGFTGKQVQKAHMTLAQKTKNWPHFDPPEAKAELTILDVIQASPGQTRNAMIKKWGKSVWDTWGPEHGRVIELVEMCLDV